MPLCFLVFFPPPLINYDKNKLVKAIERRKIKTIKRYQEEPKDNINLHKIKLEQTKKEDTEELNKAMFIISFCFKIGRAHV